MADPRAFNRAQIDSGRLTPAAVDLLVEEGVRGFQAKHGLIVDGVAGVLTRAALEQVLGHAPTQPPPAPTPALFDPASVYPVGKGAYMSALVGGPERLADELLGAGCAHVALLRVWQTASGKNLGLVQAHLLPHWIDVLRRRGLDVGLWAWGVPDREEQLRELLIDFAADNGVRWVIVDDEAPFKGKRLAAIRQVQLLHARAVEKRVGLVFSGMGTIHNHQTIPYRELLALGSAHAQFYVAAAEHPGHLPAGAAEWRALGAQHLGFDVPLWGCQPPMLRRLLDEAKAAGAVAYTGWRIENGRKRADLWRTFAAFQP